SIDRATPPSRLITFAETIDHHRRNPHCAYENDAAYSWVPAQSKEILGEPANLAAKRSGGGTDTGIYMTNTARAVVRWSGVKDEDKTALTKAQIRAVRGCRGSRSHC
ncbi:hypothetical protein, partial [Burkholderia multivorans]|uniref:hypothetical protein n=1 Tax=Burkholderia multivorans TaxID=87883 RepID=UPI0018C6ABC5